LWLATADGGLCASLYAASEVRSRVTLATPVPSAGGATEVRIVEQTDYPFDESIRLRVQSLRPSRFPLYLRVPRWCRRPSLELNGQAVAVEAGPLCYLVVERTWSDGDRLVLRLPMCVGLRKWAKNKDAVSVDRGPLSFALAIGEKWVRYGGSDAWPEWEILPTTPWNYGLVLDPRDPARSFELVRKPGPPAAQPFTPADAPLLLRATARRIPQWRQDRLGLVGPLPASPVHSEEPVERVTLIPMGAARLRIACFPTIAADRSPAVEK